LNSASTDKFSSPTGPEGSLVWVKQSDTELCSDLVHLSSPLHGLFLIKGRLADFFLLVASLSYFSTLKTEAIIPYKVVLFYIRVNKWRPYLWKLWLEMTILSFEDSANFLQFRSFRRMCGAQGCDIILQLKREREREREVRYFLKSSSFLCKLCQKYFTFMGAAYCYSTKIRISE
jgi:hypothetical protein